VIDDRGNPIEVGDTVQVLYIDRDRGAELWMHRGKVVGFGRTRVRVQFPSRAKPSSVGPECLRVIVPTEPTQEPAMTALSDTLVFTETEFKIALQFSDARDRYLRRLEAVVHSIAEEAENIENAGRSFPTAQSVASEIPALRAEYVMAQRTAEMIFMARFPEVLERILDRTIHSVMVARP
jgi:hypothetical protein